MKTEDQIKALLELGIELDADGITYNAIIPLVRKQSWHIHQKIWLDLCFMLKSQHIFIATPAQLCEALLKATGRWTE